MKIFTFKIRLLAPNATVIKKKCNAVLMVAIMEQYFAILALVVVKKKQVVRVVVGRDKLQKQYKTDVRRVMAQALSNGIIRPLVLIVEEMDNDRVELVDVVKGKVK
jgi:hypothetical protein